MKIEAKCAKNAVKNGVPICAQDNYYKPLIFKLSSTLNCNSIMCHCCQCMYDECSRQGKKSL